MNNRPLKLAASLCILFCTVLALHQTWFLLFTPTPDPLLAGFFARYRISSTIDGGLTVAIGLTAAIFLITRQTSFRGCAVGIFCLLIIWKNYVSSLTMFFGRPFGDGSLRAAASGWWHLHSSLYILHIFQFTVLITAVFCAFYGVYVLRSRTPAA